MRSRLSIPLYPQATRPPPPPIIEFLPTSRLTTIFHVFPLLGFTKHTQLSQRSFRLLERRLQHLLVHFPGYLSGSPRVRPRYRITSEPHIQSEKPPNPLLEYFCSFGNTSTERVESLPTLARQDHKENWTDSSKIKALGSVLGKVGYY